MLACLEELDVCVEEVSLGDVDALGAQLVHQAQDAGGDGGLPREGKGRRRRARGGGEGKGGVGRVGWGGCVGGGRMGGGRVGWAVARAWRTMPACVRVCDQRKGLVQSVAPDAHSQAQEASGAQAKLLPSPCAASRGGQQRSDRGGAPPPGHLMGHPAMPCHAMPCLCVCVWGGGASGRNMAAPHRTCTSACLQRRALRWPPAARCGPARPRTSGCPWRGRGCRS